jgi:hypothetical protein
MVTSHKPLWAACPDRVGDAEKTSKMWKRYHKIILHFDILPAFVVQDGHKAKDIPDNAEVIFVGGTTEWKRKTIRYWCKNFPRVHVGRINTLKWLRYVQNAGAESCDGTGWGRGDKRQLNGLIYFLEEQKINNIIAKVN